jgi:hypothetical protein
VAEDANRNSAHAQDLLRDGHALAEAIQALKQQVIRTVRQSAAEVDRRASRRIFVGMQATVHIGHQPALATRVIDLSDGGARLETVEPLAAGTTGTLTIAGFASPLDFVVLGANGNDTRVRFNAGAQDAGLTEWATARAAA